MVKRDRVLFKFFFMFTGFFNVVEGFLCFSHIPDIILPSDRVIMLIPGSDKKCPGVGFIPGSPGNR